MTTSSGSLGDFIEAHRPEIVKRCLIKIGKQEYAQGAVGFGIPALLTQLVEELAENGSQTRNIHAAATTQGRDLYLQGFTASAIVNTYGSVCQSVTSLAVELSANIEARDFRTFNSCLDDAIGGAVSEYARQTKLERDDRAETENKKTRGLAQAALTTLDAIQTGTVGTGSATAAVLRTCLVDLLHDLDRPIQSVSPLTLNAERPGEPPAKGSFSIQ